MGESRFDVEEAPDQDRRTNAPESRVDNNPPNRGRSAIGLDFVMGQRPLENWPSRDKEHRTVAAAHRQQPVARLHARLQRRFDSPTFTDFTLPDGALQQGCLACFQLRAPANTEPA